MERREKRQHEQRTRRPLHRRRQYILAHNKPSLQPRVAIIVRIDIAERRQHTRQDAINPAHKQQRPTSKQYPQRRVDPPPVLSLVLPDAVQDAVEQKRVDGQKYGLADGAKDFGSVQRRVHLRRVGAPAGACELGPADDNDDVGNDEEPVDECHRTESGCEEVHGIVEALVPRYPWRLPPLEPAVLARKVMVLPVDKEPVGAKYECEIALCTAMSRRGKRESSHDRTGVLTERNRRLIN